MKRTVTVKPGRAGEGDLTNSRIQRAVDELAREGGGNVEVPSGTYLMHDALHLRSDVHVLGENGTILRKVPSVTVALADYLGYGHYEFTAVEPSKLAVGMGVLLTDGGSFGFYDTVATIVDRNGELFFIDRMLNHDYDPAKDGRATSVFSLVEGTSVKNVSVENLTLDGNSDETETLNGCRGGGAYLLMAHGARLSNLTIVHYRGDAISFQQCTDVRISGCDIHDNLGGGIHPGSGSVRYVLSGNHLHDNGGYGVFYCLRTTHSLCENNRILRNRKAGISIGERDTDHIITGNTITGNAGQGIEFRLSNFHGGDRVRIEGNTIEGNCSGEVEHEIGLPGKIHDVVVVGNRISPRKGKALYIGEGCTGISFASNTVLGRAQVKEDIRGDGEVSFTEPRAFPAVGPDAAKPDAARHLGIEVLASRALPAASGSD